MELFASIIPGFPPVKTQHIQPDDGTKPGDVTKQGDGTKQEDGTSTLPSSQTLFELRLSQQYGAYLSTSMPCLTTGPSGEEAAHPSPSHHSLSSPSLFFILHLPHHPPLVT